MRFLPSVIVGLALALAAQTTPATAYDPYYNELWPAYRPARLPIPDVVGESTVIIRHTEVHVIPNGAHAYGYKGAYLPGTPEYWRPRDAAYGPIFSRERRFIYDAGLAAEARGGAAYYAPYPHDYVDRPKVYSWSNAPRGYGSIKDYAPPVRIVHPVEPAGDCGHRFREGRHCLQPGPHVHYQKPSKRRYVIK